MGKVTLLGWSKPSGKVPAEQIPAACWLCAKAASKPEGSTSETPKVYQPRRIVTNRPRMAKNASR